MATYKDILLLVYKVSAPLKKIQENMRKVTPQTSKFQELLDKLNKTADLDRIDKVSQKIGIGQKAFQKWDIISQNGGNVESLPMGFKPVTTQIEGVQKGSKESINVFKVLGVSVKDSNGELQKIKDPVQKDILVNRLFRRSAAELKPIFIQKTVANNNLRANFTGKMMKVMPDFSRVLENIMSIVKKNQKVFDNLGLVRKSIKSIADSIKAVFQGFVQDIVQWIQNIIDKITWVLGKLPGMNSILKDRGISSIVNNSKQTINNSVMTNSNNTTTNNYTTTNTYNSIMPFSSAQYVT